MVKEQKNEDQKNNNIDNINKIKKKKNWQMSKI